MRVRGLCKLLPPSTVGLVGSYFGLNRIGGRLVLFSGLFIVRGMVLPVGWVPLRIVEWNVGTGELFSCLI